ncbi:MAG: hypothetical protein QNK40_10575 [Desulfobacterales bacterium]|nr:hypothetical protein [Desulfobacterales bacterium]
MGTVEVGYKYTHAVELGSILIPNKNQQYAKQISNDIGKIQKDFESISVSIGELSKIEPKIIIQENCEQKSLSSQNQKNNTDSETQDIVPGFD